MSSESLLFRIQELPRFKSCANGDRTVSTAPPEDSGLGRLERWGFSKQKEHARTSIWGLPTLPYRTFPPHPTAVKMIHDAY